MFNILVVEDDKDLRELFSTVLSNNGYNPITANNGKDALDILDYQYIDLIISDVMMPEMDGFSLTRELRDAKLDIPILLITAKGSISDKQEGFRAGTDDYMVKPVDVKEMLWRVEALLRRVKAVKDRSVIIENTTFNYDTLSVITNDLVVELPQKEFLLLYKLVSSLNKIFTRRQLFDEIWGLDSETDLHTLDVHISRLREKFKNNQDFEIVTVRGLGYKVVKRNA